MTSRSRSQDITVEQLLLKLQKAEQKAQESEKRAQESEKRAQDEQKICQEAEKRAQESEKRAQDEQKICQKAEKRASQDEQIFCQETQRDLQVAAEKARGLSLFEAFPSGIKSSQSQRFAINTRPSRLATLPHQ